MGYDLTHRAGDGVTKDDLKAGPMDFTIAAFEEHVFEGDTSPSLIMISQTGAKFALGSKANIKWLLEHISQDTDLAIGQTVQLYIDPTVTYMGKQTGGIRIRWPQQAPMGSPPAPGPQSSPGFQQTQFSPPQSQAPMPAMGQPMPTSPGAVPPHPLAAPVPPPTLPSVAPPMPAPILPTPLAPQGTVLTPAATLPPQSASLAAQYHAMILNTTTHAELLNLLNDAILPAVGRGEITQADFRALEGIYEQRRTAVIN